MSFGENLQNSDPAKKYMNQNSFNKSVKFSEKKNTEENEKKNPPNNSSFEVEPRFGSTSFKKIKEILHHSKCGVQTPGQTKPNQDNYCIKKNIFNDKNLDNNFFAVL